MGRLPPQFWGPFPQSSLSLRPCIQAISIAPLQVRYYSEALPTQHGYCDGVSRRSAAGNCELRICPRSPMWRLERDSNSRPSGRKTVTLPMRHHILLTLYKCAYCIRSHTESRKYEVTVFERSLLGYANVICIYIGSYII